MKKLKAIFYGKVGLIPGITFDGYILDDNSTVMSENGVAALLGIKRSNSHSKQA